MKIAICFAGQARSFDKSFQYYEKNLLNYFDCDIFLHTWKSDSLKDNVLLDMYKPKSYSIEPPLDSMVINSKYTRIDHPNWPAFSTISSFYSIFKSNCLRLDYETNNMVGYDWIIKTRFDFAWNFTPPLKELNKDFLYLPKEGWYDNTNKRLHVNDQIAFGSPYYMNKYMSTYYNLDTFYKNGIKINGEHLLGENIHYNNITLEELKFFDFNPPFTPGKYNATPHCLIRDDVETWNTHWKKI